MLNSIPKPLVLANQWTIVAATVFALLLQNTWILLVPLISCLLSVFIGIHPIMYMVKKFLRKPLNEYVQEDKGQLKFNQWMAISFLTIAVVSYSFNLMLLFNIATIMVGVAALVAILGFCIGCFIRFQIQQWQYKRKKIA